MKLCNVQNYFDYKLQVYHTLIQLVIESTHNRIYFKLILLQVESTASCINRQLNQLPVESTVSCTLSRFTRLKSDSLIGLALYQTKALIRCQPTRRARAISWAWELETSWKLGAESWELGADSKLKASWKQAGRWLCKPKLKTD